MNEVATVLLAVVPIAWLFVALCVLRMPSHRACPLGLALTAAVAMAGFGMGAAEAATAALEGAIFACWPILLVIIAAMTIYRYSVATGGMDRIRQILHGVSRDRRVLVLILAWGFGGFLEATSGFGTPILIPGTMLVTLGFSPLFAVFVCLVANTAAVPFASIGLPVETIAAVTGTDSLPIGLALAEQLFVPSILLPFVLVALAGGSVRAVRGVFRVTLVSGLSFAVPMLLLAAFAGPELPTLVGSVCSIFATVWAAKKWPPAPKGDSLDCSAPFAMADDAPSSPLPSAFQACLPFGMVLIVVVACNLIGPLHGFLARAQTVVSVYTGADAGSLTFTWVLAAGVLLFLAAVITCAVQRQPFSLLAGCAAYALRSSGRMAVTIMCYVALAKIMNYAGMSDAIATALILAFGGLYPLIAPLIGTFGVFITGSDTTCAVLFGGLQYKAALSLGMEPSWILASNLAGASMGKMISVQSIVVGTGVSKELVGKEGEILKMTIGYGLAFSVLIGAVTLAFSTGGV